ncbi:MAG: LPS export ABC transporter periplasmic protein LptC [Bdellovibrionales bacterium]|nr:LPS export ABC transporter periplasmic protein LptC [Bdellovibrionales bacterium]
MWKWLLASLFFVVIVVELVFFAPESGDREIQDDLAESEMAIGAEDQVEQVLSGGHLVEAQGEEKQWELESEVAKKIKGSEEWILDKVNVKFFGENDVFYKAKGLKGYVGEGQDSLKIEGDIKIDSSNKYQLMTEIIFYQTKTRKIDGPQEVTLIGPPEKKGKGGPLHMKANNFDADLNTNIINMWDKVRGRKKMSDDRNMKIASREAQFSGQSNIALFKKDVVIDVDTMTITGPRAKFIYKDGELYSMFIDGGVKIKDIGKWGVAGEAEVFFQEDKYIFRDSPKVVQGEDQLIGDEIVIFDKGERVQVKKAKAKYRAKQ